MKLLNSILLTGALLAGLTTTIHAGSAGFSFPRKAPEDAGVSSERLLKFIDALDQVDGMHSVMLVVQGQVIAEGWWHPYAPGNRHTMYSLSKSFASTAIGIAQAEGKLSVDDTVVSFFPDLAPADASANVKQMRIRDLLAMSTGHHGEAIGGFDYFSEDAVKNFLALPVAHQPGTHFVYNTPASFMLSAIVHKVTGQNLVEYLGPRLFEPLGIENPKWDAGRSGISAGGFGLHIRTEDIARFGWLYWMEGKWNGKQLLPKEWVSAASARQTSNGSNPKSDWDQGYGYQFWRCRNGAYRGDGAFGQYCIVFPNEGAVLAITSGVRDMQQVLNITWDHLLPALRISAGGQPRNPQVERALRDKLDNLTVKAAGGTVKPTLELGKPAPWKIVLDANDQKIESISISPGKDGTSLTAVVDGKEATVECAPGQWKLGAFEWPGISALDPNGVTPAAASGGWEGNSFTAKIAFTETPYHLTLKITLSDGKATVDPEFNVSFGPAKRPQLSGRVL